MQSPTTMSNAPNPTEPTNPPGLASLRQKATAHHKDTWHSLRLNLETVTPVYGGATTAGEPDLLLPFRPRAIKNGLRHWWWMLNRHKPEYKDDGVKLYQDMTAIWGGASDKNSDSQRAKVRVSIEAQPLNLNNKIQSKECERTLGYVLWMSLQAELAESGATLVKPGYRFLIQIEIDKTLDKDLPQLNSVINAWLHLGGIGARSSRGLGKVKVGNIATADGIDVKKFFSPDDTWFADFKKCALIQHQTLARQKKDTALKALEISVDAFKTFRQARQHGRIPSGKVVRINRSYWPKADVVRFLTNSYPDYHAPHPGIKPTMLPTPELLFGAPIVYKFKDKRDPKPGMLSFAAQNQALDRFASPLLLTVVRISENEYWPSAFALRYWSDVADKQVCVEPNHYIEPGKWWPDISQETNRPIAQKLLSDAARHPPKLFDDAKADTLRDAMVNSAVASGNPLIAFLKFFASWDNTKK